MDIGEAQQVFIFLRIFQVDRNPEEPRLIAVVHLLRMPVDNVVLIFGIDPDFLRAVPFNGEDYRLAAPKLLNNDAFTDEADRNDSDLDQWNQSFPADELPKAGKFCDAKLPCCFLFPTKEAKTKNNIACAGQTVPLTGKAKALHLLVTATDSNQESRLAIEYADGKVDADLKVTDWCLEAAFGEKVAVATKNRIAVDDMGQGIMSKEAKATHIWCVTVPLDAKRELKSVKLPYNAQIHIFALSLTK